MTGKFSTIVADPPWEHKDSGRRTRSGANDNWNGKWLESSNRSVVPYDRMTLDEIKALPVGDIAAKDAHLYLWTTNGFLREGFEVLDAWGFRYSTTIVWCKKPMGLGLGGAFSITTEYVLFGRRGNLKHTGKVDTTWNAWKRQPAHSQKPDAFNDLVEQVSPGPYLEMFARRARFGWSYWGDQSLGTAELGGEAA